jgi:hypothetical protein
MFLIEKVSSDMIGRKSSMFSGTFMVTFTRPEARQRELMNYGEAGIARKSIIFQSTKQGAS